METPALRQMPGDLGQHARHIQHFEAQIPGRRRRIGRRPGRAASGWRPGGRRPGVWVPRAISTRSATTARGGRRFARAAAGEEERSRLRPHPPGRHWRRHRHWPAASAPAPWRDAPSGRCRRRVRRATPSSLMRKPNSEAKAMSAGRDVLDAFHRHRGQIGRRAEGQAGEQAPACARCRRRRHPSVGSASA